MICEIQLMTNDKYYNDFTDKAKAIRKKFKGKNFITPNLHSLYETDDFFAEISYDHMDAQPERLVGVTFITKDGQFMHDISKGGRMTFDEAVDYIKQIDEEYLFRED